jgi:hypothetical protein
VSNRRRRRAKGGAREEAAPGTRRKGGLRVPSYVMVPVGLAVGWFVASWPGAIFGGIVGVFLWRSRA